jgi:hypothetical protein
MTKMFKIVFWKTLSLWIHNNFKLNNWTLFSDYRFFREMPVSCIVQDCGHSERHQKNKQKNQTPWSESASELYRPSDRRISAKWLPTFADKGCHMVSVTDPYGSILDFSRQGLLLFYQVAPQLYSRGWVDPVPDPLLVFLFFFLSENLVVPGIEPEPPDL